MRTWATWSERLSLIHWSETLLKDFQTAQMSLIQDRLQGLECSSIKWSAPPVNCLRMDVDAAYIERTGQYAFGGLIRNHQGHPLLVFGRNLDRPLSVTAAELFAIEGGLRIARDHGFQAHQVASDSLLVVQAVTRRDEDHSYVGSIAQDIQHLMESQRHIKIMNSRRSDNTVAHSIDAFVISSSTQFVWEPRSFPFWLNHLVTNDISSS
ncbi:uncharacterized protein [Henckelia pumila]|uniref:uncharacterized protein n=1 Tax=Henckelia pumila TaxID=405737 RepID=UPI003C6DDC5D